MTVMNEFGDEPDTTDLNNEDPTIETADEYGGEPEPGYQPPPDEAAADQNPGHTDGGDA